MRNSRSHCLAATLVAIGGLGVPAAALADKSHHEGGGVEAQMKMMDTNGDGKISAEEHVVGAKKMFEMMDADKDGKVTAAEMEAAHEHMMGGKSDMHGKPDMKMKGGMSAADKIKMVDTNGDGSLSLEEQTAGAKMMFEKMDTDKDGFLTKDEVAAGHAKMMMMHKPAK